MPGTISSAPRWPSSLRRNRPRSARARTFSSTRSSSVRCEGAIGHADVFGNFVVAVNASHLLDQVDLASQIAPPGGRNNFHTFACRTAPHSLPKAVRIDFTSSTGTSIPSTRGNWLNRKRDRGSWLARVVRHPALPGPVGRRPAPESAAQQRRLAQSTPRDRRLVQSDTRRDCAVPAAGGGANRQRRELGRLDQQVGCPSGTSESTPPITPPSATGRSASAITHMPGPVGTGDGRSLRTASSGSASRTMISGPLQQARSKACNGWPHSIMT